MLVKTDVSQSASCYILLYDESTTAAGSTENSFNIKGIGIGEWVLFTGVIKTTQACTGNFKWRVASNGAITFTAPIIYTVATPTDTTEFQYGYPRHQLLSGTAVQGKNYPQTSTDTTTSIVDTGIFRTTPNIGFRSYSVYDVYIRGQINAATNFRTSTVVGQIVIATGASNQHEVFYQDIFAPTPTGSTKLTVSAVFWNGSVETTLIALGSDDNQIRIKIDGYISSTGNSQQTRIIKRL